MKRGQDQEKKSTGWGGPWGGNFVEVAPTQVTQTENVKWTTLQGGRKIITGQLHKGGKDKRRGGGKSKKKSTIATSGNSKTYRQLGRSKIVSHAKTPGG